MLPQALAAGIFMPISGKLFDRIGARPLVISGMALLTIAAFMITRIGAEDGISSLMLPLSLIGAGMGLSMMPLNTHLIQSAPQNLVGRVTSLTNAAQQVMASFAIAGLATILTNRFTFHAGEGIKSPLEMWASSYSETFLVLVVIAIIGMSLGFLLTKPKKLASDGELSDEAEIPMMMHG